MKLGFICPNVPGHLNPMTALARRLQARHHEVVFLYASDAAGLPVVDIDERDDFNESRPEVSKMQGEEALQFSLGMVMARTETILKIVTGHRGIQRSRRPGPRYCSILGGIGGY